MVASSRPRRLIRVVMPRIENDDFAAITATEFNEHAHKYASTSLALRLCRIYFCYRRLGSKRTTGNVDGVLFFFVIGIVEIAIMSFRNGGAS